MIALGAAQPSVQVHTREVDQPDDLALGAGGTLLPDSDNHLYRVGPTGDLYRVTARTFGSTRATGLVFAPNGDLLVGTLGDGGIHRVTLRVGQETGRAPLVSSRVGPSGWRWTRRAGCWWSARCRALARRRRCCALGRTGRAAR